ncbi:LacI family DNA-binding transcriptional regulator [Actinophytocola gossypii]|uniref:LacI family DNA-binding transcriptional regulator n=1 Tax=Actinophytocola gossypii TaxID=2812003 RepID=A0ABT2J8W2_9PSEU|nr:LacI family DNA-binding transcriptional regulator [Actinophytocola gossypii]MCT2584221.1 LacI family DNA-binding transcriptional regulator [Actinophytocola gossypii]
MRVTIAEVARRARVSKTTVSRVLNNKGDVDASTAIRVREVIAATGYTPSAGAVGLARGRTQTVGMLVPGLTWPWMGDVLQGVADVLEARGYGLLLNTMNRGEDSLTQFARHVSSNAFDGLLLVEPPDTLSYITSLHESGLPVVMIDDRGHHPGFPSVATSNREGAADAAAHLLATGRRRVAMVSGPAAFGCTRDRTAGLCGRLTEAGVEFDGRLLVEGDFTREGGRAAVADLLATGVPFDAVFAHNDLMAVGVLDALRAEGREVPDDVAVIGFDDIAVAAHTRPALTTVRQPSREMGEAAATMLLDNLNGVALPETPHVVPTSLVVRDSAPA